MPGSDVICSTSHSGKAGNNIAIASFCPSRKNRTDQGRGHRKGSEGGGGPEALGSIERFCNAIRRHPRLGSLCPVGFEQKEG
jgi:hypothetical protein